MAWAAEAHSSAVAVGMKALVDELRALPEEEQDAILARCSARELAALRWAWREFWARPDVRDPLDPTEGTGQVAPAVPFTWWGNIGGRGSGKTESCSRWVHEEANRLKEECIFTLLGQNLPQARKVMIEGPSGLKKTCPPWLEFEFQVSVEGGKCLWSNGAIGYLYGAEEASAGRGPQCNRFWMDDPAAYGSKGMDVLKMLLLGFRLPLLDGSEPKGVISTSPVDSEIIRWILNVDGGSPKRIVYSRSSTYDNRTNLAEVYYQEVIAEFEGTELADAEIYGIYSAERSGKAFKDVNLSAPPVAVRSIPDTEEDHVVAFSVWIDPSASTASYSCRVGVVGLALTSAGHVYAFADGSKVMTAHEWPEVAWDMLEEGQRRWPGAQHHFGVEVNTGGTMGPALLEAEERIRRMKRDLPGVSVIEIRTAKPERESAKSTPGRGSKTERAAPVVKLAKRGFVHILAGLEGLRKELKDLDDRAGIKADAADAFIHGVLDLALGEYSVGGKVAPPPPPAPPPIGSVVVGPAVQVPIQAFQFSMPGFAPLGAR